jgi:hypothetical protein
MEARAASRCSPEVARVVAQMVHHCSTLTVTEGCHRCQEAPYSHTSQKGVQTSRDVLVARAANLHLGRNGLPGWRTHMRHPKRRNTPSVFLRTKHPS